MATKTKTRITLSDLKRADACEHGQMLFSRIFPNGAPITFAAARKASANGIEAEHLADLLRGTYRSTWNAHLAGQGEAARGGLNCCSRLVVTLLRKQYGIDKPKAKKAARRRA